MVRRSTSASEAEPDGARKVGHPVGACLEGDEFCSRAPVASHRLHETVVLHHAQPGMPLEFLEFLFFERLAHRGIVGSGTTM